ncbi:MAG: ferredoxin--NADP reductase [bacterium]|nr:ferredoxin--NADP reductase [bacterium]
MLNATIVKRIDIAKGLAIFCVKPDEGLAGFIPGQYATLGLFGTAPRPEHFPVEKTSPTPDKIVKRPYSIASSAHNKEYIEFYIAILPEGELTSRLELVKENDRVFMAPKMKGTFTLEHVPEKTNLIMISTGTGIAPYLSMLRTPGILDNYNRISLIQGVRYQTDLAYKDELKTISNKYGLTYETIVSRPESNWNGQKGYVQDLIKKEVVKADPSQDHVLLCGNPAMIKDVSDLLETLGFKEHSKKSPGNIHIEKYW